MITTLAFPCWPVEVLQQQTFAEWVYSRAGQRFINAKLAGGPQTAEQLAAAVLGSRVFQFHFERRLVRMEKDGAGKRTTEGWFLICIGSRN